MSGARDRGLMLALLMIALLQAATLLAYRPAAPSGPLAPADNFSADRAMALLRDLVGDGVPHPIGSAANARVREAIVKRLTALGYATELQTGFACDDDGVCGSPVNIIGTLRGPDRGAGGGADGDTVLLVAHYDSVPAGPGASDDGAGTAAVLEIARILAALPPTRHPIVLLLTDGEEAGLLGAQLFVRAHPWRHRIGAAVNLEARGTSGPSFMFETGSANAWLMRLYSSHIARPVTNSLFYVVYKQLPNDTDFTVFKAAAYQGFNFAFIGHVGRYHTPQDNAANASPRSMQSQGDNALAALLALANADALHPPVSDAVFFDVSARTLIVWPAQFTLPATLAALALLLAEAVILRRAGVVTGRALAEGLLGTLCMLAAGVAASAGLLALLIAVRSVPALAGGSWIAHPLPMHIASAALALAAAGGAGAWLAGRAGFWGSWLSVTLLVALLCVVSALLVPGASFIWLLTLVAAGLAALPCMWCLVRSQAPPPWAMDLAALLPVAALFGAVLPLLRFLYTALGSLAWPVTTLVLGIAAATLLPLLAVASRSARQRITTAAALLALCGGAVTLFLPTYSAEWPERINLEYWLDADGGQSHYLARCDSSRLPPALAAAAHFDPTPRPRFAGSSSMAFYAPAPRLELAAPELTALALPALALPAPEPLAAAGPGAAAIRLELRLRSARGAPEALVVFPASAHITELTLATAAGPLRAKLHKLKSGATLADFAGLPADGVKFSVEAAGPLPVTVQVFDQSYEFRGDQALLRARPQNATSSQDGDLTVVHRTVSLEPAAGR